MKNQKNILKKILLFTILCLLFISPSFAGTDGQELQGAYDKFSGIIGGVGGKLVALFSGFIGILACAVKFNPTAILSFFGVSIGVGSISLIVDSTVTCLINF